MYAWAYSLVICICHSPWSCANTSRDSSFSLWAISSYGPLCSPAPWAINTRALKGNKKGNGDSFFNNLSKTSPFCPFHAEFTFCKGVASFLDLLIRSSIVLKPTCRMMEENHEQQQKKTCWEWSRLCVQRLQLSSICQSAWLYTPLPAWLKTRTWDATKRRPNTWI